MTNASTVYKAYREARHVSAFTAETIYTLYLEERIGANEALKRFRFLTRVGTPV